MFKKSKIRKSFNERLSEIKDIKAIDMPQRVVLVNKPFYDDFLNWVTNKKYKKPKNLNTDPFFLGDKIKPDLKRGIDYEVVGINLWGDIVKKFGTAHKIEAVLVKNPQNGEDTVLIFNLNCIEFSIYLPKKVKSTNTYSVSKMPIEYYTNSDWILEDVKTKICEIYSIDKNSFSFTKHKATNVNDRIDEKSKMSQVSSDCKNELDLRQNKLKQTQEVTTKKFVKTSNADSSNYQSLKMHKNPSTASKFFLDEKEKKITENQTKVTKPTIVDNAPDVYLSSSDPSSSSSSFITDEIQPPVQLFPHEKTDKINQGPSTVKQSNEKNASLVPLPVGLNNLGNTCYFNAAVQCLARVMPLTRFILSDEFSNQINRFNVKSSQGSIARAYKNFLENICHGSKCASRDISDLRKAIIASYRRFANHSQQDSQELLCCLLDGLHEDMNQSNKAGGRLPPVHISSHSDGWQVHVSRNASPIVDIFHGILYSCIICPSCGHIEKVREPFVFLSIEIPRKFSSVKLESCLAKFSQKETLDSDNKWHCEKCKKMVCATKEMGVEKCGGKALIIHLKRFSGERRFSTKIETTVDYPDILDASTFAKNDKGKFKLIGAVFHNGGLGGGHYTAAAIDPQSNEWYSFNDSTAKKMEKRGAHSKWAYILFYQRIE